MACFCAEKHAAGITSPAQATSQVSSPPTAASLPASANDHPPPPRNTAPADQPSRDVNRPIKPLPPIITNFMRVLSLGARRVARTEARQNHTCAASTPVPVPPITVFGQAPTTIRAERHFPACIDHVCALISVRALRSACSRRNACHASRMCQDKPSNPHKHSEELRS